MKLLVSNSTVTACLGFRIALEVIGGKEMTRFDARVWKTEKATFLVFRSGRVVCVGGASLQVVEEELEVLLKHIKACLTLNNLAYTAKWLRVRDVLLNNLVAHGHVGKAVNLQDLAKRLIAHSSTDAISGGEEHQSGRYKVT